ncbi:hypothetical protein E2C01_057000 [Portunus trituberculatus]|uniref:Uncharacterized protein n=1 Tax=Portunus trituberculatus TaxID=210409 RepID=A0A5B7GSC2_PORTR|nr:hypothetical protein [Portunus trituberculatus]
MECTGIGTASVLEDDLALSEDDVSPDPVPAVNHWPALPHSEPLQHAEQPYATPAPTLPVHGSPFASFRSSPSLPAFALRDTYVKLSFPGDQSTTFKLRRLSEITKAFNLQRDAAEVKMASVKSRFVYISRQRLDILERVKAGEFLSLPLVPHDSLERPRKFPQFILTRYPVDVDHRLAERYPGVYSARRFIQDGSPIDRIVVVWNLPDPPPSTIAFEFLPLLPPCEVRRLHDDRPWCFRCWGIDHISRYCSVSPKCAWCAAAHDSRKCPASSSTSEPSPPPDTSRWKCPRCLQPGDNVWHGCARRRVPPRDSTPATPLPPAPATLPPQDLALRKSITSLQARCAALEERFASMDAKLASLVAAQAATDARLSNLVETQQAVVSSVSQVAERMGALTSRFDKLCELLPCFDQSSACTSSTTRSPSPKRRVRH